MVGWMGRQVDGWMDKWIDGGCMDGSMKNIKGFGWGYQVPIFPTVSCGRKAKTPSKNKTVGSTLGCEGGEKPEGELGGGSVWSQRQVILG